MRKQSKKKNYRFDEDFEEKQYQKQFSSKKVDFILATCSNCGTLTENPEKLCDKCLSQ